MNKNDFTRTRKQSFSGTLLLLINRITKTLSVEIDNFIRILHQNQVSLRPTFFTKSAFVQCRKKIKAEAFTFLSAKLVNEFYTDNEDNVKLWKGFRLLAVDGSLLTLPNTKDLQKVFGISQNQTGVVLTQGRASVLYDVLNGFSIDSILSPLRESERSLALRHLDFASNGDLILYDRGYPSFEMIYEHKQRHVDFLFRIKIGFNNQVKDFVSSRKQTDLVRIYPPKNASLLKKSYSHKDFFVVRLVKVILSDGSIEVLMTSLLDFVKYDNKLFKDLYFMRWKVETYFDELKNKLQLTNFSGYSELSIYQDFYSTILVSNIQTVFVREINEELHEAHGHTKYCYKVNANVSYGILKNRILDIFFSNAPIDQMTMEIKELLKKNTIPIRPDRKSNRPKRKYRTRTKPVVTKNHKVAF